MRNASFAALLLVAICSVGALPANADHIIPVLTGDFYYETEDIFGGPMQGSFYDSNTNVYGSFALYPGFSSYQQTTTCDQYFDCVTFFSGLLHGGFATMSVTLPNNETITLNSTFGIGGSVYGEYGNFCIQGCYDSYQWSTYVFSGYWSNGWYSTFSGSDFWDFYFPGSGEITIRTQTTPEPSSLALLWSGVLSLIGYGRKRVP